MAANVPDQESFCKHSQRSTSAHVLEGSRLHTSSSLSEIDVKLSTSTRRTPTMKRKFLNRSCEKTPKNSSGFSPLVPDDQSAMSIPSTTIDLDSEDEAALNAAKP